MVKDPANFFRTDLFIRPLGALGRSVMETIKIDSIVAQSSGFWIFQAADATGILPGNRRFLVYIKAPSPDAGFSQKLLLQPIDARTGKKIGDRIVLHSAFQLSVVKIDPAGRFVLFTDDGLLYLALDAAGHASGRSKVLTDLDVGPIDLLRETVK